MNDDLISRKAFMEYLGLEDTEENREENVGEIVTLEDFDRQATAFDKEKVLEELNSERNLMYREDGTLMGARTQISIDRAVDIVEKGGIE